MPPDMVHHCYNERILGGLRAEIDELKTNRTEDHSDIQKLKAFASKYEFTASLADTATSHLNMVLQALDRNTRLFTEKIETLQRERCDVSRETYQEMQRQLKEFETHNYNTRLTALEKVQDSHRMLYRLFGVVCVGIGVVLVFIARIDKAIEIISNWFN